jgi:imidazolonepropionase-like amidohydrolase
MTLAADHALTGATVLPMTGGPALPEQTVLVRGGRIVAMGRAGEIPLDGAETIDARGKFLIPGLADMHVHISASRPTAGEAEPDEAQALRRSREYLFMFLCAGVTTVRNMAGIPRHLVLRAEVARGETPGPRIVTAGPILETRFTWPGLKAIGRLVASEAEAREAVLEGERAGYDFVKVYNDIDAPIYDAILRTARERGLKVAGHVAFAKGLAGALAARQDSIEHLRSYDFAADIRADAPGHRFEGWLHSSPERMAELAARTAEAGVWNVPTLVTEAGIAPDDEPLPRPDLSGLPAWLADMIATDNMGSVFTNAQRRAIKAGAGPRMRMVCALHRAGAKLMAGSDCPACGTIPGRSLIHELDLFVASGLTPLEALRCATVAPAEYLGDADSGTIAVGKRADLVLLDADPTSDIAALRRIAGVTVAGRHFTAAALRDRVAGFDKDTP